MSEIVKVRAPATVANLGPGFDCLAISLDLWNEAIFTTMVNGLQVEIDGEGEDKLPRGEDNLVVQAAQRVFARFNQPLPGLRIHCTNHIPPGSGLGSSAAASLLGLVGANVLLGRPLGRDELLEMAVDLEGHPDNAAAGLWGGLVVIMKGPGGWVVRRYDLPPLRAAMVVPAVDLPTSVSRRALPQQIGMGDAVFNLSRVALVVEALRIGDLRLLGESMDDHLHQPYRLPLIPGAVDAVAAARRLGGAAALSGAGPGLIAFHASSPQLVASAMEDVFSKVGVRTRSWIVQPSNHPCELF